MTAPVCFCRKTCRPAARTVAGREIFSSTHVAPEKRMGFSFAAPLAGRDSPARPSPTRRRHFNPRAPCGARPATKAETSRPCSFQSTRPLRGATQTYHQPINIGTFQSTRPLRGATAKQLCEVVALGFQSTRPLRGATGDQGVALERAAISIHAPLAGRDARASAPRSPRPDFNPRAPCGARQQI